MTREQVINFLNGAEERYSADQWLIDDINIWPLVKINLFFKWFRTEYPREQWEQSVVKPGGPAHKIKKTLRSCYLYFRLMLRKKKKVGILFSGAGSHRVQFGEWFINRYYQPLLEYVNTDLKQEALVIEYMPRYRTKKYKPLKNAYFLEDYRYAVRLLQKKKKIKRKFSLQGFDQYINEVNQYLGLTIDAKAYQKHLENIVEEIKINASVYDIFLKKFEPRLAFGLCYYNNAMFSLNYSAFKRGIPSVDMQHGGQGALHPSYSGFNRVPATGYNLMPKIFWCWDAMSANTIKSWSAKQSFHRVVVGGNPWLGYVVNSTSHYAFPDKKIILYTMQFNELEEEIVEAIKGTPSEFVWWLRLHPRKAGGIPLLLSSLKEQRLHERVEIEKATQYPLPAILSKACVHLSRYSGSVIEASEMGVKTILIDPVGVSTYPQQIAEGSAIDGVNKTGAELVVAIINLCSQRSNRQYNNVSYQSVLNELLKP